MQIEYETCGLSLFTLFVKRRTNSCEKSREKGEGGNWGAATQYMYDSWYRSMHLLPLIPRMHIFWIRHGVPSDYVKKEFDVSKYE